MKQQAVVIFSLNVAEAAHTHDVLCGTLRLSPDATDLHDALRDGLRAAAKFPGDSIEVEITLGIDLLEEVTPLFATRNSEQDVAEGLDPILGVNLATTLLDALTLLRRTVPSVTIAEAENFAYKPSATKPGFFKRILGLR